MGKFKKKITSGFVKKSNIVINKKVKAVVDKESYAYYKKAYLSRKKSVEKAGRTMNDSYMLTEDEWKYAKMADGGQTNREIINHQAYSKSNAQAKHLQKALEYFGIKKSITDIRYNDTEIQALESMIRQEADRLKSEGFDSYYISEYISSEIWGSP